MNPAIHTRIYVLKYEVIASTYQPQVTFYFYLPEYQLKTTSDKKIRQKKKKVYYILMLI
jgi:hypothetical protein